MKAKLTKLKNGLRIVTVAMPDHPTVTVMAMVAAGTRYETQATNGLSHFLEHLCFKGTDKRSNKQVAYELESIGAATNAFTSYDYTGYYAKGRAALFPKLLDVVSDVYLNSNFPEAELEKERGVIIGEIDMYQDLPYHRVQDLFAQSLYGDQPAGFTIIGPKENIRVFSRQDFLNYRNEHYVAEKTVIVVAGGIDPKIVTRDIAKAFTSVRVGKNSSKKKITKSAGEKIMIGSKKTDQAHLAFGLRAVSVGHPDYIPYFVASAVLGQGMSSRLFVKLREEMGAGYYVQASLSSSDDSGEFQVATGTQPGRVAEVVAAIRSEIQRMRTEKLPDAELNKTKEYLIGTMYMGMESTDALASHVAASVIYNQAPKLPRDLEKEIRAVTSADVLRVSKKYFKLSEFHLAAIGPDLDRDALEKVLQEK